MSLNAGDSPSQHSKLFSACVFSGALLVFWNDSVDSLEIIRIQGWREVQPRAAKSEEATHLHLDYTGNL